MDDTAKQRTEEAIGASGLVDFRDAYRERLKWLKDAQPQAFTRGLSHYNDILVKNITNGADPISEWIVYGKLLGELSGPGQTVVIDETGRSRPFNGSLAGLILHLPEDTNIPALALAIPRQLSDAQRATLTLLVRSAG